MIEAFSNIATAFGLSSAAGLNAYLPLLIVAVSARLNLLNLNEPWDVMTNWWVIGALVVLIIIEMTVDKIPVVDSINDVVQTVGRPAAGAVLFAASSGAVGNVHPAFAFIAGLLLAGGVHAIKTAARPAITASTVGTGNWIVSIVEDVVALISSILAILVPLVMALLIVLAFLLFIWWRNRPFRRAAA